MFNINLNTDLKLNHPRLSITSKFIKDITLSEPKFLPFLFFASRIILTLLFTLTV